MADAADAADPWAQRAFLRDVQYRTDGNLAARQSIYACQHPRIDLAARVLDLAAPRAGENVADIGCGNGMYLAELARRGLAGRGSGGWILGADLSAGMLMAARGRLRGSGGPARRRGPAARGTSRGSASRGSASRGSASRGSASRDDAGGGGPGSPAASVGLLAADAAALPFRDGSADLTLAMHMLYHVPDPSLAVRELRRVTRAGGRLVVGLNGPDHLRELREVIAAARDDDRPAPRERLDLAAGETLLRSCFPTVTRHDFVAELRVPGPEPIADYVRSMSGTHHGADPERLAAAVLARLPATPGGVYTITTHAGCLIAGA